MRVTEETRTITIDLFEDFICPWCRIGRANLTSALARWDKTEVFVRHRPYLLDPGIPPEGNDFHAYTEYKFGGNADRMHDAITAAGTRSGVDFDFPRMRYIPNTLAAHMLVELAPEEVQNAIVLDLFEAHFHKHRNIGSLEVLAAIGERHGVDPVAVNALDASHPVRLQVVESMKEAVSVGVTGVPFFVFDNRYGVSGAQPPETLIQVLNMTLEPADE